MIDEIVDLIKRVVGFETLMEWVGGKLTEEYGVKGMEVKRVKDAVVLVIKSDDSNLDKIEKELRSAISKMGFTRKIEVEVVRKDGQRG